MSTSLKYSFLILSCVTAVYGMNNTNMTTAAPTTAATQPTNPPPLYCSIEKKIPNCIPPPPKPDPFQGLDQNVVKAARAILLFNNDVNAKNDTYVVSKAAKTNNYQAFMELVDGVNADFWNKNCPVTDSVRQFLENDLVAAGQGAAKRESVNTMARYNKTLFCKKDCNFDVITKLPVFAQSSMMVLINDSINFGKSIMPLMDPEVQKQCRNTIGKSIPPPSSANEIKSDLNLISLLTPTKMGNFSGSDSLDIAKALSTSNKKLDEESARSLGRNVPKTANAKDLLSLASSIPIECFNQTSASDLVNNLGKMDLDNMDSFRKTFIAKNIMEKGNKAEVTKFLTDNSDPDMLKAVTSKTIDALGIDITTIPAKNLPKATLKKFAQDKLANASLSSITSLDTLSLVLPGIKKSTIDSIPKDKKIDTIINMMNASLTKGVEMNSNQRSFFRDALIAALIQLNGSDPAVYMQMLTSEKAKILYPLFIEAPAAILEGLASFPAFSDVVQQVISMPAENCCKYIRESRKVFTKYAIGTITTNTVLTYANLVSLGSCLATTIPVDKLSTMNSTDFLNYYSTIGKTYQPDAAEAAIVAQKLAEVSSTYDPASFVFNTAGDLALFYNNYASLNAGKMKENGAALISKIKVARDPTDSDIQLCRLGLPSDDTNSRMSTIGSTFVNAYIASLSSRRRRRAVAALTCADINNMAGSLNSIPATTLGTMITSEFTSCMSVLGSASNNWGASQLSTLSTLTKNKYTGGINTISNSDIALLGSILYGFTDAELAQLVFTNNDGISALGALNKWTDSQLTNGLRTPVQTYLDSDNTNMTSSEIQTLNNLACVLDTAHTNQVTDAIFVASVSTLSRISSTCPNLGVWYAKAKASPSYGAMIYNSTSAITELGTIMGGISISDLSLVSSEDISSMSAEVFAVMPASTVNTLSPSQMTGLSAAQVNGIQNSPNYASFSSIVKSAASSLSSGGSGEVTVEQKSSSATISYNLFNLVLSTMAAMFIFKMA